MRQYEFTDPSEYLLPETDPADLCNKGENIKASNTSDIADRHLRKKSETKRPTENAMS